MKSYYVYIITNKYRTTLYVGITIDLNRRIGEHSDFTGSNFTQKYNLKDLIYFEEFSDVNQAIAREKQIKNWKREWKLNLIKTENPSMKTLNIF